MPEADPRIEAFFADAKTWREELAALRAILRACPVAEEFKWRSPCYTAHGGNIATIWGLERACVLSFFKGVLLEDRQKILVPPGEHSRSVRLIEFTGADGIAASEAAVRAYILEAIENEKAGRKVTFERDDLEVPEELAQALADDPALETAFAALTPGRRRGYILNVSQPKNSGTRRARIDKHAPRILAGKGLHDR